MIDWKTPDTAFIKAHAEIFTGCPRFGSDASSANIFLLSRKYGTLTASANGAVLRYYNGSRPGRNGYGFPLFCGHTDLAELLGLLSEDAQTRGTELSFCLCDERQKAALDKLCSVDWKTTDDDSDYIYKRESLAALSGKKLHRKRNHINSFMKIYDGVEFRPLGRGTSPDALTVAEKWLAERGDTASDDERSELDSIMLALDCFEELGLFGGVLYVGGVPAAMTVASSITAAVTDVHFEKSYGEYAENGAFAVINQKLASSDSADYFNREEDMGIPGLRTAKESYFPAFKLKKYYGVCKC